jgi:hypothetical protein
MITAHVVPIPEPATLLAVGMLMAYRRLRLRRV